VTPDEAVVSVLAALDAAAIPYMLVGSVASNFHGIPRSVRDAFVVQLPAGGLQRLAAELPAGLRKSGVADSENGRSVNHPS
jgi:hypothetical protein